MRAKSSKNRGSMDVEFTSRPVSGWGGLVVLERFMRRMGVRDALRQALPDGRTSNNRVDVVDYAIQFLTSVVIGGTRFEHAERLRGDDVVRQIMRIKRYGSASSITRYFGNFTQGQSEHLHVVMSALIFGQMERIETSDVLDLDSTVFTRYGDQQGSTKGYNPHARGERSHHPLLAMFAQSKLIPHAWLREGSASPHKGNVEFVEELLSRLPAGFRIQAVRADSGFYSRRLMDTLDGHGIPYVIAAQMAPGFSTWCKSRTGWIPVDATTAVAEDLYKSPKSDKIRRIIVVRYTIHRETDARLFECVRYEYRALATSMTGNPVDVYRFYQKRGDCENRIKELKYDFNADKYCLQSFAGTEAAFRLICFLFNVVALFKAAILKDRKLTLGTIRTKIFVVGAAIGRSARRTFLRLGLQSPWSDRFDRLLEAVNSLAVSTAAQLIQNAAKLTMEPPSPWSLRRTYGLKFLSN